MKTLKKIVIVLLIIILIPLIVALFVPKESTSIGEVTINKPKQEVFEYIKYVKNQDNFGVWQLSDPEMETISEGTDGTEGFKYSWDSEEMGKGAQVITKIVDGERMESDMYFYDFDDTASKAFFTVEEKTADETLVKWGISWTTPYPWNLMSLFYNMDSDFEKGLETLKEILESRESPINDRSFATNYFAETFLNLQNTVTGLDKEQLHFKPSKESWSISQCLEHIILTENMIFEPVKKNMTQPANPDRREEIKFSDEELLAMATDRSEKYKAPEILITKGKYDDPETALHDLKTQREEIISFIMNTPIQELRNRVNDSPSGASDSYQSLLFLAGHTARHTLQIEEIKAAANFPN
ncbi:MAG TPA: DinB family protein [Flavobacteriaceae bacterium]|nr:DinB family protein [Flavobacteriaceae bacterium]